MTTARRWLIVSLGVAMLVALPLVIRALPVAESRISQTSLLDKAQASGSVDYSGYVESLGTLQLPVSSRFTDLADLLGGKTTLRVWWRGPDDWRVDKIGATGETDIYHDESGSATWDYESNEVTLSPDPRVRLPQSSDLLPPELARRLLDEAEDSEVSRIASRRVAGLDAAGMRLTPADAQSSIGHIDVWVEPASGLPVDVEVYGDGATQPSVTTRFLAVTLSAPSVDQTDLTLGPGSEVHYENVIDIADAANQFAPFRSKLTLAGLETRPGADDLGAVGVYGRGATLLVAIPLWRPAAEPLREQLAVTPGALVGPKATSLGIGLLNLQLTTPAYEGTSFLVVGSVTPQTLNRAARQLKARLDRGNGFTHDHDENHE